MCGQGSGRLWRSRLQLAQRFLANAPRCRLRRGREAFALDAITTETRDAYHHSHPLVMQ